MDGYYHKVRERGNAVTLVCEGAVNAVMQGCGVVQNGDGTAMGNFYAKL